MRRLTYSNVDEERLDEAAEVDEADMSVSDTVRASVR